MSSTAGHGAMGAETQEGIMPWVARLIVLIVATASRANYYGESGVLQNSGAYCYIGSRGRTYAEYRLCGMFPWWNDIIQTSSRLIDWPIESYDGQHVVALCDSVA